MIVEMLNIYYILPIFFLIGMILALYFIFRNKSERTKRLVILIMVLANFALHFLKLAFLPYRNNFPNSLTKITFVNICAVSTIIFPFLYLSKKRILLDYMFYFGVISGGLAMLIPTEALGEELFKFDTIRFYLCHMIIIAAPLLMVIFKIHKPSYKKCYQASFIFFLVLTLILLNEVFLSTLGLADITRLLDRNYRNNSFVFGPTPDFDNIAKYIFLPFVPEIFRTIPFGENAGQELYWPVIWLIIPVMVYCTILSFLICLPFDFSSIKNDFKSFFRTKIVDDI